MLPNPILVLDCFDASDEHADDMDIRRPPLEITIMSDNERVKSRIATLHSSRSYHRRSAPLIDRKMARNCGAHGLRYHVCFRGTLERLEPKQEPDSVSHLWASCPPQALQTLSVVVQNARRDTSLYYLLSGGHLSALCREDGLSACRPRP